MVFLPGARPAAAPRSSSIPAGTCETHSARRTTRGYSSNPSWTRTTLSRQSQTAATREPTSTTDPTVRNIARTCSSAQTRAQLRPGERVVDIGCGTGASSIALAERAGPSGEVLGIDVSTPMLAAGCRTAATGRPGQICTRRRDDLSIRIGRFPFFALWRHVFRGAGPRFCQSAHGAEAKRTSRLRLLAQVR